MTRFLLVLVFAGCIWFVNKQAGPAVSIPILALVVALAFKKTDEDADELKDRVSRLERDQ